MSDTAPIRPEERFDESRLATYLTEVLPGHEAWRFEQFPGGKANLTYLARSGDGAEFVVRRPPLGPLAPGSHDMAREYLVLSRLHDSFPAAPRAYALCDDVDIIGAPFVVMERRRGHVVREAWPEALDAAAARRRVAENLIDTLIDLHRIDVEATGLGELGKPEGFAERQVSGWQRRWDAARHAPAPSMQRLGEVLRASIPPPIAPVLLHNDFKLDNVMLDDAGDVVAVFDWDMATLGDPRFDIGTVLAYWITPDDAVYPLFAGTASILSDVMDRREVKDRYISGRGPLPNLDWYEAFALFRVAVIVQQIAIRFIRGQTSDPRFRGLDTMVEPMAQQGLALLGLAGGEGAG